MTKNEKTHWRNMFNEQYLGSWDLEINGQYTTATMTIERIFIGEMINQAGKQQKAFIKFKENQKPMVCNKTNFKRLEKRFGTFDHSQYIGHKVIVNVEKVDSPEGKVDSLRILSKKADNAPAAKKTLSDERFELVFEKIKAKEYTVKELCEKHYLTNGQQLKLDAIC